MVRIYSAAPPPLDLSPKLAERLSVNMDAVQARKRLDKEKAKTLAKGWFDVCEVARSILTGDPSGSELAEASIAEVLRNLDGVRIRVPPLIADE